MEKAAVHKIHAVGGGSYRVTIPKEWIIENNIQAGDHILMRGDGPKLVLEKVI